MGIFNAFKKRKNINRCQTCQPTSTVRSGDFITNNLSDSQKTVDDLPWGWISQNQDFIGKIEKEYSYFLHAWIDSTKKSPRELYSALKSFVFYMEEVKKICASKDKYFEFWFNNILTSAGYLETRKKELDDLTVNVNQLQKNYEHKNMVLSTLKDDLWNLLYENESVLQTDLYKHFDECVKSDIHSILYDWSQEGKISRVKSGRTYKITKLR